MCNKTIWNFIFLFAITPLVNLQGQQLEKNQKDKAISYLINQGLSPSDFGEMKISDQYYSASLDMHHTYFQQYYMDIPMENAILNVGFKNGDLVNTNNTFAKNININPSVINRIVPAERGLTIAKNNVGKNVEPLPTRKKVKRNNQDIEAAFTYDKGSIAKSDIEVSLVWIKEGKSLKLCWQSIINVAGSSSEHFIVQVDALTGEFVKKQNLFIECNFDDIYCPEENVDVRKKTGNSRSTTALTNTYNVFDLPIESPNHGSRTLTSSPWNRPGGGNPAATLGWHNDGSSSYTITRGNNVYAYEDQDANDLPGYSPDGGGTLDFDFPFIPTNTPASNVDAALTNLFHTCNLIHDIMYQYGFDEPAGNFQTDNQGRGGSGNDHVLAEGLDGGGTNNANFGTPPDGQSGQMQMFLWSEATLPPDFILNSPANITSPMDAIESGFSTANKLFDVGSITEDVVLVEDQSGGTHEGCTANPINNGVAISGKIALIDRGNCDFTEKVKNAQNEGAIAAIVVNNIPLEGPIPMGGTDNTITIPAVMISFEHGQEIKDSLAMGATVNVTLIGQEPFTPDGSYDNGIIIHEYGHGISNRLTGGPAAAGCLQNDEQMGEGWSDFFSLMLITDWSTASSTDSKGIGTYAIGEPTSGTGIRTYPYTTDMGVNPFTYGDLPDAPLDQFNDPSPHFIGSIWGTILWDMTWKIIDITPASPDIYHGTGGNNIAMQLVMDGLKLQACSPGFVDGRDAILMADEILYLGAYKCVIWEAFAGRGLGVSASQGLSTSHTDGTEAFDLPNGVILTQTLSNDEAIEGEIVTITTEARCNCVTENGIQVKQVIPSGAKIISVTNGSLVGGEAISSAVNLDPLETFTLVVEARMDLCSAGTPEVSFSDDIEGADMFTDAKLQGTGNIKWITSSAQSNSPTTSWYAENYNKQVDLVITQNSPLNINKHGELSFFHRFQTEATWDGGVVEISTDGGLVWEDLGPYFTQNGYPSAFASNGSSNLAGRAAFTGDSDVLFGTTSFVESIADLGNFIGESIQIRFRSASDDNSTVGGIQGWHVDDITFTEYPDVQVKGFSIQSGSLLDSLFSFISVSALNQSKFYVDDTSTGASHGGDWANAYLSLQDAFQTLGCNNADTINLAAGSYLPFNQRDTSFIITSDMVILGGFPAGGGTRNPLSHFSVLSGDIGTPADDSDNTYHVVLSGAGVTNAVLDGVIIENGNANGGGDDNEGSGIFNLGDITLRDVTIRNSQGLSKVHNKASGNVIVKAKQFWKISILLGLLTNIPDRI